MTRAGVADRGLECVSRSLVIGCCFGNSGGRPDCSVRPGQGSGNRPPVERSG